ncbi:2-phospho-L-lactate guanylyltransferase [Nocardioides iriomotensis]|uniref:Phosphoenolpyruvate guanylyltransferase n=1 Tax=Nocardioides iriomotensis TaxID=715784 RepID=A0A4Q5J4F9_9ACTN|nr:2-phospho-L-lactate guanylyltransferase [Nocardioides iriomotensis]RYU12305.1 2-phospho-L-lactate guanylyltransferase [Nocardioides iriomotensis]
MRFGVVVPVKPPKIAKSRLGGLGEDVRQELAAAFAADTVAAALASSSVDVVLAVTDDHRLAAELRDLGAEVMPDVAVDDLNASLLQAVAELVRRAPGLRPAAICADLPALRPAELDRALAATLPHDLAFVADADGIGTTLLSAAARPDFRPGFGPGSRLVHLDHGAVEVGVDDIDSVRRDVDTPRDLAAALRLGIGPRTSYVTAELF